MSLKRTRKVEFHFYQTLKYTLKQGVFSKLKVMEAESEIFREINEWERFIDEACVELNVEVKTAENEVQERKLREEAACVRGVGAVGNIK